MIKVKYIPLFLLLLCLCGCSNSTAKVAQKTAIPTAATPVRSPAATGTPQPSKQPEASNTVTPSVASSSTPKPRATPIPNIKACLLGLSKKLDPTTTEYRTLWVVNKEGRFEIVEKDKCILAPYKGSFNMLVVRPFTDRVATLGHTGSVLFSYPVGNQKINYDAEEYRGQIVSPYTTSRNYDEITFVGPQSYCVLSKYESLHYNMKRENGYKTFLYELGQNPQNYKETVGMGESDESQALHAAYDKDYPDETLPLTPDQSYTITVTDRIWDNLAFLKHFKGRWHYTVPLLKTTDVSTPGRSISSEIIDEFSLSKNVPVDLTGYDTLGSGWSDNFSFKDAVSCPDNSFSVVLSSNSLYIAGKIDKFDPKDKGTYALSLPSDNENIIMSRWTSGAEALQWDSQIRKVKYIPTAPYESIKK